MLFNALLRVIERGKSAGNLDINKTIEKIDIFYAADKLTSDEYLTLIEMINK